MYFPGINNIEKTIFIDFMNHAVYIYILTDIHAFRKVSISYLSILSLRFKSKSNKIANLAGA